MRVPRKRSERTSIVGRRKMLSPPDGEARAHRLGEHWILRSDALERTHTCRLRPSPLAAARVQETLYERRARCTITISRQFGFRLIGNAENANKTDTPYARSTRGDVLRNVSTISSGRRCTRMMNLPLLPSRVTIFIIVSEPRLPHKRKGSSSDVYLMSRFIRKSLNSRGDESLNWAPSH